MTFIDPLSIVLTPEELEIEKDIAAGFYSPVSDEEQEKIFAQLKQASKNRQDYIAIKEYRSANK